MFGRSRTSYSPKDRQGPLARAVIAQTLRLLSGCRAYDAAARAYADALDQRATAV
jgi:hypothetical protein